MKPRKLHKNMNISFQTKPNPPFYFLLLTSTLLTACASTQPHTAANYSSYLNDPVLASRQVVTMSDEESDSQPAGSIVSRQTASSETVIKKGKIKKQTSTTEEVIETDTSTVVDTFSVPTADQDAR